MLLLFCRGIIGMKAIPQGISELIYKLPADCLTGTDDANAQLFMHLFGEDVRYCPSREKWLLWNQKCWEWDTTLGILRMADMIPRALFHRAGDMDSGPERDRVTNLARKLERTHPRNGMLNMVRHRVVVSEPDLNSDPFLLNCLNGTLNLFSQRLRAHERSDLLTCCSEISYDPEWVPWTWKRFLKGVFSDNEDTISYIQRLAGYSLTGLTKEHVFMICWGNGANGKSVFLNTLRKLLGPLALQAMPDLLLMDQGRRHPTELAELCGRRLVVCQETGDGRRFNEALVKNLTGGDPVTARRLYEEQFTFTPTHKIWLATNYRPVIRGTDHGIWRRTRLIPFENQFTESSKPPRDPELEDQLTKELPGILNWAVEGLRDYLAIGLGKCDSVSTATAEYQADMDIVSGWIGDCCRLGAGEKFSAGALFKSYQDWCAANGETAESQKVWAFGLKERGLVRNRAKSGYFWLGISLTNSEDFDRHYQD